MTAQPRGTPPALAHNLRYNKILHEHVIVLTVTTAECRMSHRRTRSPCAGCGYGIYNVRAQYGFMQDPHVPEALGVARDHGVELDPEDMIYFLGRETIIVTRAAGHGALAGEAIRVDGAQRGPCDGVLPAAAGARRRARRQGRNVGMPSTCGGRL